MLRIITPDPVPAGAPPEDPLEQGAEDFEIVLGRRQVASLLFVGLVVVAICSGVAYMAGRAQGQRQEVAQAQPAKPEPVKAAEAPRPEPSPEPPPEPPAKAPEQVASPPPQTPPSVVSPPPDPVATSKISVFPPLSELRATSKQPQGRRAPVVSDSPVVVTKMPPPVASEPRDGGPTDEIEASLFADPIPGARYIQVGSVDRGVAVILAEGLRTRGFNGFIAPGAKNGVYRVLVGPLRTNAEYQRAKEAVDRMGVSTFTRQFDK